MCGIVGLFFKDDQFNPRLGELLAPMLISMTDRGPDSAGFAVYGDGDGQSVKITVHAREGGVRSTPLSDASSASCRLISRLSTMTTIRSLWCQKTWQAKRWHGFLNTHQTCIL